MPSHYAEEEEEIRKEREEHQQKIMKNSLKLDSAITLDIPDVTVLKLAVKAHEKGITLNKMINLVIDNGIDKADFKSENSPQLLNETE